MRKARHPKKRRRRKAAPSKTQGKGNRWGTSRQAVPPRLRRQIMERDQRRCQLRGPKCLGQATMVDHIINVAKIEDEQLSIDPDDPSNLQAACRPCHEQKTAREANAARPKRKREPEPHPGFLPEEERRETP